MERVAGNSTLKDYFPWDDGSIFSNQFLLVLDKESGSGEFAFVELLLKLARSSHRFLLFACNHSREHYESILRKKARYPSYIGLYYVSLTCLHAIRG